jgi:hypothetical protein
VRVGVFGIGTDHDFAGVIVYMRVVGTWIARNLNTTMTRVPRHKANGGAVGAMLSV